jgi:hypothetical protein
MNYNTKTFSAKEDLEIHYLTNYAHKFSKPKATSTSTLTTSAAPAFDFMAQYCSQSKTEKDELAEYFKLPPEDFDHTDPIAWWHARRAQFPNLYILARNGLAIPGTSHNSVLCLH